MHNHLKATLDRLERVQRDRITPNLHRPVAQMTVEAWPVGEDGEPVSARHALGLSSDEGRAAPDFRPFEVGQPWGPAWNTTWFRLRGTVPEGAGDLVELVVDLGWFDHSVGGHCEGFVFTPDGTPVKALHPRNTWVRLRGPGAVAGLVDESGHVELFLEAAANPLLLGLPPFVVTEHGEKGADEHFDEFRLRAADIAAVDMQIWELSRDLEVAGGLAAMLSPDEPRHWHLLRAVEDALDAYDGADPSTAAAARAVLAPVLGVAAAASAHQVSAVGHAHIDSAWLWPLRETVRKVGRTVSNVLALLDSDPDFVYAMSAAQHYVWLQEVYPELFERVRRYVAEGRFVPVGGMWVEADGVVPTGESLVRQMTVGKRYFAETFGIEPEEVWLPDSFGYSGAWPQLARRAGFRWFLTQKISWNDTTAFPHHSFWWEGIDGTRIFTHFPPSDTYAAEVTAAELRGSVANFRDKAIASHSLMAFGYGDGGGGPIREMVARAHRFADLDGSPKVAMRRPDAFFADAEAELDAVTQTAPHVAPVWSGELYLELHRGTLTSQVEMKRLNRRSESLLRVAEALCARAAALHGVDYPAQELGNIWRTVLLHQFHDVLPGTSIAWVHREARATYAEVEEQLRAIIVRTLAAVPAQTVLASGRATTGGVVEVVDTLDRATGTGYLVLDNGMLRATWDSAGHVVSLYDHASRRELAVPGLPLNVLQLFRDEPVRWDAWDIDRHVLRHPVVVDDVQDLRVVRDGEDVGVEVVRLFGSSRVRSTTWLRAGAGQLDSECEVDWQERDHLLKVAVPVAVQARTAQFETQYGVVDRPVHTNTPADEAMFEVGMHRFVRVGEPGYGVGLLNDGMYGADVRPAEGGARATVLRISLLRGPSFPDPATDRGTHVFRWAVRPGVDLADTVEAAGLFNTATLGLPALPARLVELDRLTGHAVLDWVKLADDGSGDVVVRVYEATGARARARLVLDPGLAEPRVWETDLLERPVDPADDLPCGLVPSGSTDAAGVAAAELPELDLGPFQVATIRIAATPRQHPDLSHK